MVWRHNACLESLVACRVEPENRKVAGIVHTLFGVQKSMHHSLCKTYFHSASHRDQFETRLAMPDSYDDGAEY